MNKLLLMTTISLLMPSWMSVTLARPEFDVVVSKDGRGNSTTIQEAVTGCRDYADRQYVIFVKKGVYREKLVVPTWKTHISLIGEDVDSTIVTFDDYSGKISSTGQKFTTFTSHTCLIAGYNTVIENITFVNTAGRVGQAVAMHVEGDRCAFRNCKFIGNQDTHLTSGENSRQYYVGCYIEGTTDFIFGAATAVFDSCTIVSKKNSYVTAASTLPSREWGLVFIRCRLLPDSETTKVYLGRPWRLHAYTAFIHCYMGPHILPEGWHNWNKPEAERTARYFEFMSYGPGANAAARASWSRQLTETEVNELTPPAILRGLDNWYPFK